METVSLKLGDLQSYELKGWKVNKYVGTGGSYTRYNLDFQVIYSKGSALETLTINQPAGSDKLELLGFNINSKDLIMAK